MKWERVIFLIWGNFEGHSQDLLLTLDSRITSGVTPKSSYRVPVVNMDGTCRPLPSVLCVWSLNNLSLEITNFTLKFMRIK